MIKDLQVRYNPSRILCLFVFLSTLLMGCQQTPINPVLSAERPQHWAMLIDEKMNLYKIDDGIYRSQQPTSEDIPQLEALGIKTIINLRGFHSDDDIINSPHIELVRIPIHTWRIKDAHIISSLQAVEEARKKGSVLIHCQHGADRTGLISAMYRIIYQGWSKEEAWEELQNGGFGYHSIWINIPKYIERVDLEYIRKELEK